MSDKMIIKLITKKIPNPSDIGTPDYFKIEIRNLKLKEILDI